MSSGRSVNVLRWHDAASGVLAAAPGAGHRALLLVEIIGGIAAAVGFLLWLFVSGSGMRVLVVIGTAITGALTVALPLAAVGGLVAFIAGFIAGNGGVAVVGFIVFIAGLIASLFFFT